MSSGVWGKSASQAIRAPMSESQREKQQQELERQRQANMARQQNPAGGRGRGRQNRNRTGGRGRGRGTDGNTGPGGGPNHHHNNRDGRGFPRSVDRDGRDGGFHRNKRDPREGGFNRDSNRINSGNNNNNNNNNHRHHQGRDDNRRRNNDREGGDEGGGRGSRGGGKGGRGRGKGGGGGTHKLQPTDHLQLLLPGEGVSKSEQSVKRVTINMFLAKRLASIDVPEGWDVPDTIKWKSDTRIDEITASIKSPRATGEVSAKGPRPPPETAPPIEECKPLEVNEETRWKARVFSNDEKQHPPEGTDEEILRKALLILNKLSMTKFEKLSDEIVATGIGRSEQCLQGVVGVIVEKAQSEPHFSTMYARLSYKLSKTPLEGVGKKAFKKMLLSRCQQEFEDELASKVEKATEGIDDEAEKEYQANIAKKKYLGHMRFIGELFKVEMIKNDIMVMCLSTLLEDFEDEKVECFTKLMTTIGYRLQMKSYELVNAGKPAVAESLRTLWLRVDSLVDGSAGVNVSNRIKFMLLDLKELKQNGWIQRREVESAKTIDELHKDIADEEKRRKSGARHPGLRRASTTDMRSQGPDQDGFHQVSRSSSMASLKRSSSMSDPMTNRSSTQNRTLRRATTFAAAASKPEPEPTPSKSTEGLLSPEKCEKKAKSLLQEYFVGGDLDDAVLSVGEIVAEGKDDADKRGAKVIETGTLLVMEKKEEDVKKFLAVILGAYEKGKIGKASFINGLNDPLEYLRDIEVDAPFAAKFLVSIVAAFVKKGIVSLDFLLEAPEDFRTGGEPARFAAEVVKAIGGEASDESQAVIEQLKAGESDDPFASTEGP